MVNVMPVKKMRVEVSDEQGNRYTMTFEGKVTREKALNMLDIVELLGGVHAETGLNGNGAQLSKFGKVGSLVGRHFFLSWFSSKDVLSAYEQEFREPISLATVSTYLARMADRGMLMKIGTSNSKKYRLFDKRIAEQLEFRKTYNR